MESQAMPDAKKRDNEDCYCDLCGRYSRCAAWVAGYFKDLDDAAEFAEKQLDRSGSP